MKNSKVFSKLNILIFVLLLTSCQNNVSSSSSNSSSKDSTSSTSGEKNSSLVDVSENKLIISEYIEGLASFAIELYNLSDETVDLKDYKINVYGTKEITPTGVVELSGTLDAKETYVIVGSMSVDNALKEKADLISEELAFNGSQALALAYKNVNVDVLGNIGYKVDYAKDVTLVRKMNHTTPTTSFDEYDWIRYLYNDYQYLGTFEASVTEEELLEGPKLTEEFINAPFFKEGSNNEIGGGGIAKVSIASYVDGDTTCFYYPEELGIQQGLKVRYQNINTPESYTGNIQEWGMPAKDYTKTQLSRAKEIYVQSIKDGSIYETYDRLLGWVWIDGELLNFKIVKEGYSSLKFEPVETMAYKGVTYSNYLYHAELYAKRNNLKIHGEKDPTWDYEKWESKYNLRRNNYE